MLLAEVTLLGLGWHALGRGAEVFAKAKFRASGRIFWHGSIVVEK
jgi:hypothetical protein